MSWKDNLVPASFRGVRFQFNGDGGGFGRRNVKHEYPNRDKPYAEDMGKATREISITAYLIGRDFMEQRDRMIKAIETPGPGELIHPLYGAMTVVCDGIQRISHNKDDGGMCTIEFSFFESGDLSFPTAGVATDQKLVSMCGALDSAAGDAFMSGFSLDGMPGHISDGVLGNAFAMFDAIESAFAFADTGISAAAKLLRGDLSSLLTGSPSTLVSRVQGMWRSGSNVFFDAGRLLSSVRGVSSVTSLPALRPIGVWPTDGRSRQTVNKNSNAISQLLRVTAIAEAGKQVTTIPAPTPIPATTRPTPHPSIDSEMVTVKKPDPISHDELEGLRDDVISVIDKESMRVTDDGVFVALQNVRRAAVSDIRSRLSQTPDLVTRQPKAIMPALVLAYTWYGDASRESDIVARNRVVHPGFVQLSPLRVPSK